MTTINTDNSSTLSQLTAMLSRIYHSTATTSATNASEQSTDKVTSSTKSVSKTYNRDFVSGGSSISGDGMSVLLGNQEADKAKGPSNVAFSNWFSGSDTDADGLLSEAEFVAARPDTVTEDEAAQLFSALDTENSGSITEKQLFEGLMAYNPPPENSSTAIADKFASMDTDGDGKVSKAEFVAARPEGATEAQSEELFAQIDSEGTGSITEEQFADALSSVRGAPPPMGSGSNSESTTTTVTENADGSTTTTVKDADGNVVSETTTKADAAEETYKSFLQALLDRKTSSGDMKELIDMLEKQLSA